MTAPDLQHLTVMMGHVRASPRAEVSEASIDSLRAVVFDATGGPDWTGSPIPGFDGYTIEGCRVDRFASLWRVLGDAGKPLAEWAIATQPEASEAAWTAGAALWGPDKRAPNLSAPWVAVILRGSIVLDPDAADWLPDLQRAIAWTAWDLGV